MSGRTLRTMSSAVEALVDGNRSDAAPSRRRRVAVVTDEATIGAMALAALDRTSATSAPDLRQQTEMRIRHCADPAASVRDFVDLTSTCSTGSLAAAVDALADDPGCDAVLVALGVKDRGHAAQLARAVARLSRAHPDTEVALVCVTSGHGAVARHPVLRAQRDSHAPTDTGGDPAPRPGSDR